MELLHPSHSPHHDIATNSLYGFSSGSVHGFGFHRDTSSRSQLPDIMEEAGDHEIVHVAVGKSVERAVALLQWTVNNFGRQEICVLHVHQPSHTIPTLCKVSLFFLFCVLFDCFSLTGH